MEHVSKVPSMEHENAGYTNLSDISVGLRNVLSVTLPLASTTISQSAQKSTTKRILTLGLCADQINPIQRRAWICELVVQKE